MARGEHVAIKLRELIVGGAFAPGQRLAEIPVSQRLGVSRTPVRRALALLAGEGVLAPAGARGYRVRSFTLKDILDAIDVRGSLEGMAARLTAEIGMTDAMIDKLEACLDEGETILRTPEDDPENAAEGDAQWSHMNARFHGLIVGHCGNRALAEALARNDKLPFASAAALLGGDTAAPELRARHREVLRAAQIQHRVVVEALKAGQGARAEALMREHALQAHRNIMLFQGSLPSLVRER